MAGNKGITQLLAKMERTQTRIEGTEKMMEPRMLDSISYLELVRDSYN